MSAVSTANVITLRGSVDIVSEFFDYSVNSILYQRGLYPPESYKRVSKYGLTMHMTQDEGLLAYMRSVRKQLDAWLLEGHVQQVGFNLIFASPILM
jgi:mitotic spindle assembly checkpoint protein MAD2